MKIEGSESQSDFQSEKEIRTEVELSGTKLLELLSSENFVNALKIAGWETRESGYETGFSFYIYENNKLIIGAIKKGSTDFIGSDFDSEILKESSDEVFPAEGYVNIMAGNINGLINHLHFHPDAEGVIIPSPNDLQQFNESYLEAICQIRENGDINAMLVKRKKGISKYELKSNVLYYWRELKQKKDQVRLEQKLVQEILENNGFNNCVIPYRYNKKTEKYTLSKKLIETLKKFDTIKIN